MIERNEPGNVTYDDISAVGRAGTPPILITVRSVEDSPSLQVTAVPVNAKSQREKGGFSDVRKLEGLVAQGRPSGPRSAHDGSLCVNKRSQTQLVAKMIRYLSNGCTSKTAVGSPLELGNSFLLGGTNGAPERGYVLTAAAGIGLHVARRGDKK